MRKKREEKELKIYRKQEQKLKKISSNTLFVAGLMFYLGEGDKKTNSRINLANTDIQIIKFFTRWLSKFFDVKKDDIRIQLHLYENMNILQETRFWKQELGLKSGQLYKTQIRALQKSSFSYAESYRHGTCSLYVLSTDKKTQIMMAMKAFCNLHM